MSRGSTKIGSIVPVWDSHVLKHKCYTVFWYWLISPFETQHLSACLIFSVPHLSPGLWKFLCVWMLIDIHVYNYKCTYLILSVILPVLRPFLPHFLPHALCTKNLTSTTLNQTLQYPTFRKNANYSSLQMCLSCYAGFREQPYDFLPLSEVSQGYRSAIKSSTPAMWTLEWPCSCTCL